MTPSTFKTKFGDMAYYRIGEEKKVIVFLHGFLGRPLFLEKLYEMFGPRGYCVVGPYLPGHGKSFALPKGFSFQDLVQVMGDFLESLSANEIDLIGHSMGGGLSWQLGHNRNLPIKKIVMLSPGLGKYRENSYYIRQFKDDLKVDYPERWYVRYLFEAILKDIKWQQIVFPNRMAYMVKSTKVEYVDFPSKVRALALWGKDDLTVPFNDYYENLVNIGNLKIKLVEGGHHFFVVRRKELFEELEAFLNSR